MSFLAEAIDKIKNLAVMAAGANNKVHLLEIPGEPRKRWLVSAEGEREEIILPSPTLSPSLLSVDQLATFLKSSTDGGFNPSVWFNGNGVEIVLDDGKDDSRRHRAKVAFRPTREFSFLTGLADDDKAFDPKRFVRVLRTTLRDCLAMDVRDRLIEALSSLRATSSSDTRVEMQRGRESIGTEVDSQITSDITKIPEQLTLDIRPINDRALIQTFPVRTALEIDPQRVTFTLIPSRNDLDKAIEGSLDSLAELLAKNVTGIPIFFGTP